MRIFRKSKKELSDVKPMGIKYTIERPSESDIDALQRQRENMKKPITNKVDKMILQDISDRLYGPDSDDYIKSLNKLNKLYSPLIYLY